jgi:hypothetical protein
VDPVRPFKELLVVLFVVIPFPVFVYLLVLVVLLVLGVVCVLVLLIIISRILELIFGFLFKNTGPLVAWAQEQIVKDVIPVGVFILGLGIRYARAWCIKGVDVHHHNCWPGVIRLLTLFPQ